MSDVVVTVPKRLWSKWLADGMLPDEDCPVEMRYHFWVRGRPRMDPGDRIYIVAYGRLRGYAPLVRIDPGQLPDRFWLVGRGGAVAVTIDEPIPGFRGYRYRWWETDRERPFPEWRVP
jgi:hypothetical protein